MGGHYLAAEPDQRHLVAVGMDLSREGHRPVRVDQQPVRRTPEDPSDSSARLSSRLPRRAPNAESPNLERPATGFGAIAFVETPPCIARSSWRRFASSYRGSG